MKAFCRTSVVVEVKVEVAVAMMETAEIVADLHLIAVVAAAIKIKPLSILSNKLILLLNFFLTLLT